MLRLIVIDANESQLRAAMRPHQLGCGVPDGAVLLVTATRAWASEVQRRAKAEIDHPAEAGTKGLEQSVLGIDMENAFGRILRSSCIEATLELAPGLAALTGSRWQRPVQAWMKMGDRWVAATYGTRRLAGSAAHAGPLLIDTRMADGSWCAGMGP